MADGKVGLFEEHGVDSCGCHINFSINSRGCTGKSETQSGIGPDVAALPGGRLANYNKIENGWKDRDQG